MIIRLLISFFILFVLWLLLSGHFDPLLLSLGAFSCIFVVWLSYKFDLFSKQYSALRFNLNLPRFLPWFSIELIKSNIDVCKRILHPSLPIEPTICTVSISKHNEIAKAVYANCITLTPGTFSLDISDDTIEVHALTKELAEELQNGDMSKRILKLQRSKGIE